MEPNQPNYVNAAENFAKERPLQLTLRVMQDIYSSPRFWIGAVAVIAILTVAGPFDTLSEMAFAPRLVYWGAIALVTWPMGMACSIYFGTLAEEKGSPEWLARVFGGLIGGIPIGLFVWLINKYFAYNDIGTFADLVRLTGYTTVISMAVSIIYFLVAGSATGMPATLQSPVKENVTPSAPAQSQLAPAPFFDRLPVGLGKDLISLQAQDHYIKVTTARGSEMILMRLSDAEKELESVPGIRAHRSWWIAAKHIADQTRENEKLHLVLTNGEKIPVSRSYLKQVREFLERQLQ